MKGLDFESVKQYFRYLSSVPHGSGNTKQVSDLVVKFAKENNLEYVQDEKNNVVIYKKGSAGREEEGSVILQAHLDMVCVKTDDCPIDMANEPIKIIESDGFFYADGTSLGGDDISGAAIMLGILASKNISHPPIEAVFTTDEETGMYGAEALDFSLLKSKKMINLDSENLGSITVGCAGGSRVELSLPIKREKAEGYSCYEMVVDGLLGGHSGEEIDKERGHSHFLASRMLLDTFGRVGIRLISIDGGKFDNVIPHKTVCCISVPNGKEKEFEKIAKLYDELYKAELVSSDPGVKLEVKKSECDRLPMSGESTKNFLELMDALPYGMINKNLTFGCAETSLNMGKIITEENCVRATYLVRSNVNSRKKYLLEKLERVASRFYCEYIEAEGYPCWEFKTDSVMMNHAMKSFSEMGIPSSAGTIHGGLECGIFSSRIPGLDCISVGPDISGIHSPDEKMSLDSFEKCARFVEKMLERI